MNSSVETGHAFHILLAHLRTIVGRRDRKGLDEALLLATRALLTIDRVQLLRVIRLKEKIFGIHSIIDINDKHGFEVEDVSQISPQQGKPLADYPEYQRCCEKDEVVHLVDGATHRYIIPLFRHGEPHALLEIDRDKPLDAQEIALINQLLGLFVDHLNLLDYAETDTLTGLLNRKTFDENLAQILANTRNKNATNESSCVQRRQSEKSGIKSWLAVADIDHFKRVNDTYGHIIGDEVLILVARMMRHAFRFDDQLFRFGGEEFVIVLQPATEADVLAVVERFRGIIENHEFPLVGKLTISIGVTCIDPMDTPTELIGRADQALYVAKTKGRNSVKCYEQLHDSGQIGNTDTKKQKAEIF